MALLENLNPREETQVHRLMQQRARQRCDALIKDFIVCSRDKTISLAWSCKPEKKAMLDCMHLYTNPEDLDEARNIFLLERREKRNAWLEKQNEGGQQG
ncbi:hypothetical protein PYCC9005_000556 [Savitreella phatthalungensis]